MKKSREFILETRGIILERTICIRRKDDADGRASAATARSVKLCRYEGWVVVRS